MGDEAALSGEGSLSPKNRLFRLAPGVTSAHFGTYLFAAFCTLTVIVALSPLQPYLLTHVLHVPKEQLGKMTGDLTLYNAVLLPVIALAGGASDRLGRRTLYMAGFLIAGAGYAAITFGDTLGLFVAFRLIAGLGIALVPAMMTIVLADYVVAADRGKAMGAVSMISGVGAVLGAVVFGKLPSWLMSAGFDATQAGRITCFGITGLCVTAAVAIAIGMRGPAATPQTRESLVEIVRTGLRAGRSVEVRLAYVVGFTHRVAIVVLGGFFPAWVYKHVFEATGNDVVATGKAGAMVGALQAAGWVFAPAIAIPTDRVRRDRALAASTAITALGCGVAYFGPTQSGSFVVIAIALGAAQMAAILGSAAYVAKVAPVEVRGSVIGLFNVFGGIGTLVAAFVGGRMFDALGESSPFIGAAVLSALASLLIAATGRPKAAP